MFGEQLELPWVDAGPIKNPDQCIYCWRTRVDGDLCDTHAGDEEEAMDDFWRDRYGAI